MSDINDINVLDDLKTGDVNRIIMKAREMYRLELDIEKLEGQLKEKKKAHKFISTEELPAIMAEEVCVDVLPFDNGWCLKVKPVISSSIPSQSAINKEKDLDLKAGLEIRRESAFNWLEENNADSIISNKLQIDIPKSVSGAQHVQHIVDLANTFGISVEREKKVHPSTLNSYIKEQLNKDDGLDIPFETFGVFDGKQAKIIPPKKT